jgi:hypothetical protein
MLSNSEACGYRCLLQLSAKLMKTNPPSPDDAPMVAKMAKIGLVAVQDFDHSKLGAFDPAAAPQGASETAR